MERSTLFQKYGQVIEAGKVIFREGEPGETMYIIQKGRVKITKRVGDVDKILTVLQKGDFFGEMAIITKGSRTATATAVDTCELLTFNREGFISMISKNSSIAMSIIEKLCLRLEKADNQIRDLARRDLKSLVLNALNELRKASKYSEKSGESVKLNYVEALRQLAGQIGSTEREVEAELKKLSESGLLGITGNTLEILNANDLDIFAGYLKR
ncbi:MAG: Crp/Fnr family transcriptional regulator [Spirochaetota bacterium]